MNYRWRSALLSLFAVRTAPPTQPQRARQIFGVLSVLVGCASAYYLVVYDMLVMADLSPSLLAIAFSIRAVLVMLVGTWMYWRLPWRATDEITQRLGFALSVICAFLLIPAILPIVVEPVFWTKMAYYSVLALGLLQVISLSRHGLVRFGSALLTCNLIIQVIGLASLDTAIGPVGTTLSYCILVLIAGLLVRWWFALAVALLLPLTVALLGSAGMLPTPPSIVDTVAYMLVLSAIAGITGLYTRALEAALALAATRAAQLQHAQATLEHQNAQLVTQADQLQVAQAAQQQLIAEQEARIAAAVAALRARSVELRAIQTPLIRVAAGVLVAPLIGAWDVERTDGFVSLFLKCVEQQRVHTAILDVTALTSSTDAIAAMIEQVVQAARLLGCRCVLVGVQPEMAQTLVSLRVATHHLHTASDLAESIRRL